MNNPAGADRRRNGCARPASTSSSRRGLGRRGHAPRRKKPPDQGGWNIFITYGERRRVREPDHAHRPRCERREGLVRLADERAAREAARQMGGRRRRSRSGRRSPREMQTNAWDFVPHVISASGFRRLRLAQDRHRRHRHAGDRPVLEHGTEDLIGSRWLRLHRPPPASRLAPGDGDRRRVRVPAAALSHRAIRRRSSPATTPPPSRSPAIRHQLGLDRPLPVQFAVWSGACCTATSASRSSPTRR